MASLGNRREVVRCPCCGQVLFSFDPVSQEITIRCHKGTDTALSFQYKLEVSTNPR